MLETWQVLPVEDHGQWMIAEKEITGGVSTLYKLRLPSERVLRGPAWKSRHQDIRLAFENAWVYFDNLPTPRRPDRPGRGRSSSIRRRRGKDQLEAALWRPAVDEQD